MNEFRERSRNEVMQVPVERFILRSNHETIRQYLYAQPIHLEQSRLGADYLDFRGLCFGPGDEAFRGEPCWLEDRGVETTNGDDGVGLKLNLMLHR